MNNNYWKEVQKRILDAKDIYIYGAGVVAYGIYKSLQVVWKIKPQGFIVSEKSNIESVIEDIPVLSVKELNIDRDSVILVATPELYHAEIRRILLRYAISEILYIDNHTEFLFMCEYYRKQGKFKILADVFQAHKSESDSNFKDKKNIKIYMAKCHVDRRLSSHVEVPKWVIPIQVGTDLTDIKIAEIRDNIGDNISYKNKKYSELTASYWVWKNVNADYKGICHYRRQLLFSEEELEWLVRSDIDVVLPFPFVCYPDAKGQYGRYITEDDQQILFQALKDVSPEYAEVAEKLLKQPYLYNYNMLLAKADVFDSYCKWMFPILFHAEDLRKEKKGDKEDRFAGYFGEVLTSVYFMKNRDMLKIIHTEKVWYV